MLRIAFLLTLSLLLTACGDSSAPAADSATGSQDTENGTSPAGTETASPATAADPATGGTTLINWVDRLNVRESASSSAKVVTTLPQDSKLTTTGKVSGDKELIVLRGVAYHEPWYEITTPDGKSGWVFGGALRAPDEEKGNLPITDTQFQYPYFGTFDLSDWELIDTKDESGGDATIEVKTYRKGGRQLKIMTSNVGEYGYSRTFDLSLDGAPTLSRQLEFVVDISEEDATYQLQERVVDRRVTPAIEHYREQDLLKHYVRLNSYPLMVNGKWTERTLTE